MDFSTNGSCYLFGNNPFRLIGNNPLQISRAVLPLCHIITFLRHTDHKISDSVTERERSGD